MAVTSTIVAFGAFLAGVIAWRGWKKEMRGQNEYNLARNLLATLYKYRNAVQKCLSMFDNLSVASSKSLGPKSSRQQSKLDEDFLETYKNLLRNIATQQEDIYEHLLSAEAVGLEKLPDLLKDLFNVVTQLESPIEKRWAEAKNPHLPYNRILTSPFSSEKDLDQEPLDQKPLNQKTLSSKIERYVKQIEDIVKPGLKS